jgi:excisionase family DNA binding protein
MITSTQDLDVLLREIKRTVEKVEAVAELVPQLVDELRQAVSTPNSSEQPTFYSTRDVARQLGVGIDKVVNWINAGELEASDSSNPGSTRKRWRIDRDALGRFLRNRQAKPAVKRTRRKKSVVKNHFA